MKREQLPANETSPPNRLLASPNNKLVACPEQQQSGGTFPKLQLSEIDDNSSFSDFTKKIVRQGSFKLRSRDEDSKENNADSKSSQEELKTSKSRKKELDIILENIEETKTQHDSAREVKQENAEDDFYSSFQEQIELQLKNLAKPNMKIISKRNKKPPIVKQETPTINVFGLQPPNDNDVQSDLIEMDLPCFKDKEMNPKTISKSNSEQKSLKQVSLNFEQISEESVEEGSDQWVNDSDRDSKSIMSKSAASASSGPDISVISDVMLDRFDSPEEVSAEGVKTFNELQQEIVDYCVSVGLDPKNYQTIFDEANVENTPKSKHGLAQKRRLQMQKSVTEEFSLFEHPQTLKSPISTKTKAKQTPEKKASGKNLTKLLRMNTSQLQNSDLPKQLRWCQIQNMVLTKRMKIFFEQDAKRISKMNVLQSIVQRQREKIVALGKQRRAEEKDVHFAFMFACPLALSFDVQNKTQLHLISQLNHRKEFQIIKQRLGESKAMINIIREQCTITNLQEILRKKPIGIHFSGHGIQNTFENVGDMHYQHQNEGDFLLLETLEGDSKLVSRQRLQKLISASSCKLQFVVVATCHSEFVGRIFLDAGAEHVVCIRKKDQVADEACLHFTSTFYSAVFSQKESICKAFEYAQLSVRLNHNAREAEVFQLLVQSNKLKKDSKDQHKCNNFGPFSLGMFKLKESVEVTFKMPLPRITDLVGRQKDMYNLVSKIMTVNNHLLTLIGLPGVGKSALVKSTLQYIQDRNLLRGGLIFMQARSILDSKTFVRRLNEQLISENPVLFGSPQNHKHANDDQQGTLNTFILLISKISFIKEDILFVIDNCTEIIRDDREHFKILISMMLAKIPTIKVLLTTSIRLGAGVAEANEEVIVLSGLNNLQTEALLRRKLTRQISLAEQNALLKIKPDPTKYPQESQAKLSKLHEHHLFKLLGGNPQSIILIAPLLDDPLRNMRLVNLYELLTSNQLCEILESEQIEDKMLASLRLSVHVSVKMIEESDPVCMQLFLLLGFLPGGINYEELDKIWVILQKIERLGTMQKNKDLRRVSSIITDGQLIAKFQEQQPRSQPWMEAKRKLQQNSLIEEVQDYQEVRRASLKKKKPQTAKKIKDNESSSSNHSNQKVSQAPSSGYKIQMPKFVQNFAEAIINKSEAEVFEQIIAEYFLQRLKQFYLTLGTDSQTNTSFAAKAIEEINTIDQNMRAFIDRMKTSLSQHTSQNLQPSMTLTSGKLAKFNFNSWYQSPSMERSLSVENTGMTKSLTLSSPSKQNEGRLLQKHWGASDHASGAQQEPQQKGSEQWSGLYESYNQILQEKERNDVVSDFIQRLQKSLITKPVRGSMSHKEWIRLMWRWAFKLIIKKFEQVKHAQIFIRSDAISDIKDALEAQGPEQEKEVTAQMIEATTKYKFDKAILPKIGKVSDNLRGLQNHLQVVLDAEMAVLYYIANLTLISRYSVVKSICEHSLLHFKKASAMFKANVRKYYALVNLKLYAKQEDTGKDEQSMKQEQEQIKFSVGQAYAEFNRANSAAGKAVAKYMEGFAYLSFKDAQLDGDFDEISCIEHCTSCFTEALELFKSIKHYRGIHLSAQQLIDLQSQSDICLVKQGQQINALEKELKHAKVSLLTIQSKLVQTVYFSRNQSEEMTLMTDILHRDIDEECRQLNLQLSQLLENKRGKLSRDEDTHGSSKSLISPVVLKMKPDKTTTSCEMISVAHMENIGEEDSSETFSEKSGLSSSDSSEYNDQTSK